MTCPRRLAIAVALASFAVAGCTNDPPTAAYPASESPSTPASASSASEAGPACLLTPAEVNAATGFNMDQVLLVEESAHFECQYSNEKDAFAGLVSISVHLDGRARFDERRDEAEVVPNLGDQAFRDGALTVLTEGRAIGVYLIRDEDQRYPEQEVALARLAIARYRDLLRNLRLMQHG